MLTSGDPEVKGNAAMVLGKLGDPSAIPMLREALRRPLPRSSLARTRIVELQIAEAMVKLGQEGELQAIRAALFVRPEEGEIAALACQICGRLKDEASAASLLDKAVRTGRLQEPAEVRLAAAGALASIDPARAPIEVPQAYVGSDRFEIRAQAALTLGLFRDGSVLPLLARMMNDPNPLVQVSAAGSALRLTGP
jgi:HEAT repeat protein